MENMEESHLSRYFVFWERCGAITGAVPGSARMVDGILARIRQVMNGFWLDGLVLYEIRGSVCKQRDDWSPTLDSLIMCSGLTCCGRRAQQHGRRSEEGMDEHTFERAIIRRRGVRIPTGG